MSPSCCGGATGANNSQPLTTSNDKCHDSEAGNKPEEAACCVGPECECDDSCLDQLARAICASDDGHIHPATDGLDDQHPDTESLASDETCGCEGPLDKDNNCKMSGDTSCSGSPAAKPDNSAQVQGCGLRKRKITKTTKASLKEACGEHMSLVRNRQKDTLAAFGCVCSALLARGLQSCCVTRPPIAPPISSSILRPRSSKSRVSVDSCGGGSCCGGVTRRRNNRSTRIISDGASRSCLSLDSCCNAGGTSGCGGRDEIQSISRSERKSVDSCCAGSCCEASACPVEFTQEKQGDALIDINLSDATNHAILSVKGMTCVGCENKLIKVLKAQPIITNVKTSLVLSRAEFDYAGRPEDLQALIQTIQQRTGFATERIESAHALEFIVSLSLQDKFLHAQHPDGVQQVAKGTKNTVRVIHDPQVIGAREVLSFYAYFSPILAPEPQDPALAAGAKHIRILLARTIASSILTIPVLVMTWAPLPSHPNAYAIASLVLASLVQIVIAGPFYGSAFKGLFFSSIIENDSLIVLSTTTAYIYSVVAFAYGIIGKPLIEGSFFETSTLLVTLIMFGQLASALARQRAIAAISLRSLQQPQATLVHTHPDGRVTEELVDARLIQYGDTFRVLPDSVVITDGVILSGTSSIDESMMTGESLPVEKSVDNEVLAGSVNGPGNLLVKVTRLPGENTISEIAGMVDSARGSRARVQSIVDRVCAWFVPVVLAIALITFMIWILIGVRVRKENAGQAAVRALTYAIAVLAISCPCAIGLAVPMVVLMASGVAARLGLVFKAATTIESARKMTHVVFDKTGTLTMGHLEVVYAEVVAGSETPEDEKGSVMLALASASKHPVSRAVATYLISTGVTPSSKVDNLSEVTGKGVEGSMGGRSIRGGSARWLGIEAHPSVQHLLAEGLTTFCVMDGNTLIAVYALSDTIRPEAASLLVSLRARNIGISVLSGDHAAAVDRVSSSLGIPSDCVRAGCLPADKAVYIRELQAKGAKVMFCGDGTNDSVALAQADIGVHMSSDASSSGAGAAASGASDAVLLRPSLTGLMSLMELSEAVHKRIIVNFLWAAIYNLVAILFAGGAFVNARIAPAYAGLGEIVSVLPVILVAMQLKWFKASV